jgi:hypothetical protein
MGKAAKTRKADYRKKEKHKRKEQQRALYESYKAAGTNKKSKRNITKKRVVKSSKHSTGNCGNVGCERSSCFPELARPRMNAPHPRA